MTGKSKSADPCCDHNPTRARDERLTDRGERRPVVGLGRISKKGEHRYNDLLNQISYATILISIRLRNPAPEDLDAFAEFSKLVGILRRVDRVAYEVLCNRFDVYIE